MLSLGSPTWGVQQCLWFTSEANLACAAKVPIISTMTYAGMLLPGTLYNIYCCPPAGLFGSMTLSWKSVHAHVFDQFLVVCITAVRMHPTVWLHPASLKTLCSWLLGPEWNTPNLKPTVCQPTNTNMQSAKALIREVEVLLRTSTLDCIPTSVRSRTPELPGLHLLHYTLIHRLQIVVCHDSLGKPQKTAKVKAPLLRWLSALRAAPIAATRHHRRWRCLVAGPSRTNWVWWRPPAARGGSSAMRGQSQETSHNKSLQSKFLKILGALNFVFFFCFGERGLKMAECERIPILYLVNVCLLNGLLIRLIIQSRIEKPEIFCVSCVLVQFIH